MSYESISLSREDDLPNEQSQLMTLPIVSN